MTELNKNDKNCNIYLSFESLGINNEIIKSINEYGISKPIEIQCEIINSIINSDGNDVVIKSIAGSGKTAAVIISLLQLQNYNKNENDDDSIILFLTPRRVLSTSTLAMVKSLSYYINDDNSGSNYKVDTCIGGVNIKDDIDKFKNESIQFIIGTPGRILDIFSKNEVPLINKIKILVLDEADEIFSIGLNKEVNELHQLILNNKKQVNSYKSDLQIIISTSTIKKDDETRAPIPQTMETLVDHDVYASALPQRRYQKPGNVF